MSASIAAFSERISRMSTSTFFAWSSLMIYTYAPSLSSIIASVGKMRASLIAVVVTFTPAISPEVMLFFSFFTVNKISYKPVSFGKLSIVSTTALYVLSPISTSYSLSCLKSLRTFDVTSIVISISSVSKMTAKGSSLETKSPSFAENLAISPSAGAFTFTVPACVLILAIRSSFSTMSPLFTSTWSTSPGALMVTGVVLIGEVLP